MTVLEAMLKDAEAKGAKPKPYADFVVKLKLHGKAYECPQVLLDSGAWICLSFKPFRRRQLVC